MTRTKFEFSNRSSLRRRSTSNEDRPTEESFVKAKRVETISKVGGKGTERRQRSGRFVLFIVGRP